MRKLVLGNNKLFALIYTVWRFRSNNVTQLSWIAFVAYDSFSNCKGRSRLLRRNNSYVRWAKLTCLVIGNGVWATMFNFTNNFVSMTDTIKCMGNAYTQRYSGC